MKPKRIIKLRFDYCVFILVLLTIILMEANYWTLLPKLRIKNDYFRIAWIIALIIPMILSRVRVKWNRIHLCWIAYLGLVLVRNSQLRQGNYILSLLLALSILSFFVCTYESEWTRKAPIIILIIGAPNLIATLLFYVNNGLYLKFIAATYKTFQSGTNYGQYGYRAGIAGHYSHNGTYLVILMLVLFSVLICIKMRTGKRIAVFVAAFAALIAVFLTAKRAHLLFGIAALLLTYYIANRSTGSKKLMRIIAVSAVTLILLVFATEMIPALSDTLDRLTSAGQDDASINRIKMWEYALQKFADKPIFGHGWYSFGNDEGISQISGAFSGAHNVYIQLLYEVGIVGFSIAVITLAATFVSTCRNIIRIKQSGSNYLFACTVSLSIQSFFLIYGFTGNFLTDQMFLFYAVAVMINFGVSGNLPTVLGSTGRRLKGGTV